MQSPSRHSLPRVLRHAGLVLCPLLMALGLLALAKSPAGEADLWQLLAAYRASHPTITAAMRLASDWGNIVFYPVYAVMFFLAWRRGDRGTMRLVLGYALFQLLISFLLVRVLKIALGRPRPGVDGPWTFFSLESSHNSLPSGHTAEIAGATLPLAWRHLNRLFSLAMGLLVALVGFSRVYLGQHHMGDVIIGLVLGAFAGVCIHLFASPKRIPHAQ